MLCSNISAPVQGASPGTTSAFTSPFSMYPVASAPSPAADSSLQDPCFRTKFRTILRTCHSVPKFVRKVTFLCAHRVSVCLAPQLYLARYGVGLSGEGRENEEAENSKTHERKYKTRHPLGTFLTPPVDTLSRPCPIAVAIAIDACLDIAVYSKALPLLPTATETPYRDYQTTRKSLSSPRQCSLYLQSDFL